MTSPATAPRLTRAYWRLFAASGISNLGDGLYFAALPLLSARLTRSEALISITAAAALLPWLLFALPVGAIIDRSDRKRVMVVTDSIRTVVVGVLALVVAFDAVHIWMIWVVAFALGTAEVFFDSASQAMLPAVVHPDLLAKANGRKWSLELTTNTFVGTPIGSVLFTAAMALPFGVDAVTFAIAALLVLGIPGNFATGAAEHPDGGSMYAELRTGMRWLWRQPLLRAIAVSLAITNLAFQMPLAVFVLFAEEELGIGESGYGLLLGLMGVGAIVGGLVGDRVVARLGRTACIYGAIGTWIVTMLAVPLYPRAWFVAVAVTVEAMATTTWNVVTVSLRQQIIPAELFGRVNGVYRWVAWGTLPLGALVGGQVAAAFGLKSTYVGAAILMVLALLVLLRDVRTSTIVHALSSNREAMSQDETPVARRDPLFD
ncbi:MAG: MFS transporter [Acidimicrobiales bacterium]